MENLTVKKHRAIIQASNITKLNQRKAFNVLLFLAKKQLDKDLDRTIFSTSISELCDLISPKEINSTNLKDELEELMELKLEFNILEEERFKYWHKMVLVSEIKINANNEVEFSFPQTIRKNIIRPEIFCPLNLKIIANLDSRYSITIYEFCKDYIKVNVPKIELETFKKLLGIEGCYERIYDLRLNVLDVAEKEINEKSDIDINYEFLKTGRKYSHIKFYAKRKSIKIQEENLFSVDQMSKLEKLCIETQKLDFKIALEETSKYKSLEQDFVLYTMDYAVKNSKINVLGLFHNLINGEKLKKSYENDKKIQLEIEKLKKEREELREKELFEIEKLENEAKSIYSSLSTEEKRNLELENKERLKYIIQSFKVIGKDEKTAVKEGLIELIKENIDQFRSLV